MSMLNSLHVEPKAGQTWLCHEGQQEGKEVRIESISVDGEIKTVTTEGFYYLWSRKTFLESHIIATEAKKLLPSNEIKPGSVVKLKSGGPSMTVTDVSSTAADCFWFTTWGDREAWGEGSFPHVCLQLVEDHDATPTSPDFPAGYTGKRCDP